MFLFKKLTVHFKISLFIFEWIFLLHKGDYLRDYLQNSFNDRLKAYISLRRSSVISKVKIAGYVVVKCCLLLCTTWTRRIYLSLNYVRILCWFCWLKLNLKRVGNFAPIMNVMLKMPYLIRHAKTMLVWWNLADNAQTSNIVTL